jgi:hypothetical protein
MEIFHIFVGIPGVDLNLAKEPPAASAGSVAMGSYGTPLELALSKGLPQIASELANLTGYSPNDILPRVNMNLLQWSIFRNKPDLFLSLINDPDVDIHVQQEHSVINALYLAIRSYNPVFAETLLQRIDFAKMPVDDVFFENPVVTALMANNPALARRILQHPTMTLELIDKLIATARTKLWPQQLRERILQLAQGEKEARKESMRAFGEVLYRKGAEPGLGPLVGSFMGLTKTRRARRARRARRSTRH